MNFNKSVMNILYFAVISKISYVSGQCDGCADTSSCHVFDSGNDKFLGCYGTFSGGGSGLSSLCGTGFVVPNASYAATLGFTQTMCDTTPSNTFFFIDESGVGLYCNTQFGTTDPKGLWGCGTGGSNAFEAICSDSGNVCSGITSWRCEGADYVQNGTTVMTMTTDNEYNTLALLESSYGGAICIRAPTNAPTNMPSEMPSNEPSNNPSDMPSTEPSSEPTDMPVLPPTAQPVSVLCDGCADSSSCYVFDSGNDKFVGCYGTFSGGASGLSALCGTGFIVPSANEAKTLGFTYDMCNSVGSNKIFFLDEGGIGLYCNEQFGTSDPKGLWGCTSGGSNNFEATCGDSGNICDTITSWRCQEADWYKNGTLIIDVGETDNEYNTLQLLDSSYGGAVCIRAPSPAPTDIPTNEPSLNPTNMPTLNPTVPTKAPTDAPTDNANNLIINPSIIISLILCVTIVMLFLQ